MKDLIKKISRWWKMNVGIGKTMLDHGADMTECPHCGERTPAYSSAGSSSDCLFCGGSICLQREANKRLEEQMTAMKKVYRKSDGKVSWEKRYRCEVCGETPAMAYPCNEYGDIPERGQTYAIFDDQPMRYLCTKCAHNQEMKQYDRRFSEEEDDGVGFTTGTYYEMNTTSTDPDVFIYRQQEEEKRERWREWKENQVEWKGEILI